MKNQKIKQRYGVAALLTTVLVLSACHKQDRQLPVRANFTAAMNDYLDQRGNLCTAKYEWPIVVTASEQKMRSPNARQMPVLEAHGMVKGRDVGTAEQPAREYALTAEGQKYYLHVPVVINTTTRHITHPADFCVAKLSLDRIIGWERPTVLNGRTVTSVLFTYKIAPVPWTQASDVRQAFPVLTQAIDNAGTMQLRLGMHLTPDGWMVDELTQ